MTWHYKFIEDPSTAYSETHLYIAAMQLLQITNPHNNAAIFSRIDQELGGVHFYFTPEASSVAKKFNAEQCEMPTKSIIGGLLVGDQTLIDRLYS